MDRVTFLMHVRKGCEEEYIRRHRNVWPEVMAEHARAGIRKMSIFMKGTELFLYMEVDDYPKAVRILGASPEALRWEEFMAPLMESVGDDSFDPTNAFPASLPEVFYWEASGAEKSSPKVDGSPSESIPISPPHIHIPRKTPLTT